LEEETKQQNFWDDKNKAIKIIEEINNTKNLINEIEENKKNIVDLLEIGKENIEILNDFKTDIEDIIEETNNIETKVLLNKEYDELNCIFEIHSGAGGTESCDWANMLYRMYIKFFENNGFKYEVLEYQNEDVGIKGVTLLVKKLNAYGYLKSEKGVHRLVRISPFDSNRRRHTSFASIEVIPEIKQDIEIDINEEDLRIDVYRSSGAGGQSVNTTDSAVRVVHIPTNIVVTCQNERSQTKNKEQALKLLKNKLYLYNLEVQNKKIDEIKGKKLNIEFGSQIRSYTMEPYTLVKDHRTNFEKSDVFKVLDGEIFEFIKAYLKYER